MNRMLSLAAPLLGALLACSPVYSQRAAIQETRMVETTDDQRLEVAVRGSVAVNATGDWVEAVGPGGRLLIDESGLLSTRHVEFTRGEDGGVRVTYSVDGREQEMDAVARNWARDMVMRAAGEAGLGVERRVSYIPSRGGVPMALRVTA
ncbi:hypothetical protein [Longimicrobium terrae]|uniref:Uncharacterized protein n=1 Tax=Longimicrobium terrae TaxID=1639882 RepID=A0A841GP39_9BACT|nr:hypothetical protein [Longimicrobium terrae]MBB4634440.1 hypothetical protein [Longimicrobium terrae]MBB6068670.1 hypothetical protein [Longimicrobium terrae]NNC27856.1 hypothetical protein [Longimicrobium terrae]